MMNWSPIEVPASEPPPAPMTVRVQTLAARSYFPEHRHDWAQVVYAISGVLTVAVAGRSFVISPEQGVWLPTGVPHRVGTLFGAEFRSLWIASTASERLPDEPSVFNVSLLLRALIVEAATLEEHKKGNDYAAGPNVIPRDYASRETSPWKVEVSDSPKQFAPLAIAK